MIRFFLLFLFLPSVALAKFPGFFIQFGYDRGGENLEIVEDSSRFNVDAGRGTSFMTGIHYVFTDAQIHNFSLQLGIGYKVTWDADDGEGDVNWRRFPTEAIYFYNNFDKNFRFGYGVSYHLSPSLKGEDTRVDIDRSYPNAFGYVFALDKLFYSSVDGKNALGLRYNILTYKINAINRKAYSLGLQYSLVGGF